MRKKQTFNFNTVCCSSTDNPNRWNSRVCGFLNSPPLETEHQTKRTEANAWFFNKKYKKHILPGEGQCFIFPKKYIKCTYYAVNDSPALMSLDWRDSLGRQVFHGTNRIMKVAKCGV